MNSHPFYDDCLKSVVITKNTIGISFAEAMLCWITVGILSFL